ncbi:Conserved_hypothetical protein [Hexamita inflata]|uniref:Uncharacterized protein n=1 Tax=Hexamita inflata TaxID=28002 RepID=A0AA86RG80_9EUKA|nr:Conserved hypothetical protein [Hexamita inflata]
MNNQIQFDNYGVNDTYYIDTSNGKTNMLFDINQLEGMKLKDFTITNLSSDIVEVQHKLTINSMDIYLNMNELLRQSQYFKNSIESINVNLIMKTQQINNLQEQQQNQQNVNKEFTDKFSQQANQNLIFMNEFEDHLTRIQNSELFQASQLLMNTELQNNYLNLLNKTVVYDNNFVIQDEINNKISDKVKEHQERLDIIGPCVHKINDDYVTHSEITGFASEGSVIGLSVSVGVLQTQCIAMDVGIAAAQATATASAATSTANSGLISTLQSQVVKLEGDSAMLTSDMASVKAEQTTIKVDATQVATNLKKFEVGQGITDAGLQSQITDLLVEKADKETTYTKTEVDTYFVAQTVTNDQLNGGILQLGSSKADQVTTYSISDVDSKLALKANVVDVYSKTQTISNYYDKIDCDTMFQLKSDSDMNNMMSLINNLDETKVNVSDVYTNTQIDTKLQTQTDLINTKANITDVYNKSQIDIQQQAQDILIGTKANVVDIYTKTQVDSQQKVQNDAIALIQTKDSVQDNDIANMKIDVANNNTNVQNCMIKVTQHTNDITTIKSDIVTLTNNSNNIPDLSNRLSAVENQYWDQNAIVIGTKNYLEQTLIPDQSTQNTNIQTLQNQMSSVIGVNNDQATRISAIENSISSDQAMNNYSFTMYGGLTFKFGKIDVGGALSQKTVTFVKPFKYAINTALVSCWGNSNSGGGADVGYVYNTDLNGVTITADYANSGGNKTNVYSWLVIGM